MHFTTGAFNRAKFRDGTVTFDEAEFDGGIVTFGGDEFRRWPESC